MGHSDLVRKMKQKYDVLLQENTILTDKMTHQEKNYVDLIKTHEQVKNQFVKTSSTTTDQLLSLQSEIDTLRKQITHYKNESQRYQDQLKEQEKDYNDLKKENEQKMNLLKEIKETKETSKILQIENATLKEKL